MTPYRKPVTVEREHMPCECGKGELIATGTAITAGYTAYEHLCIQCGKREDFHYSYPRLVYTEDKGQVTCPPTIEITTEYLKNKTLAKNT